MGTTLCPLLNHVNARRAQLEITETFQSNALRVHTIPFPVPPPLPIHLPAIHLPAIHHTDDY
jgi:hypothetical protein